MNSQRLNITLPSDIIENILWRLPIEEIVRSSILSKEWMYSWTKIPKVVFKVFDESTSENHLPVVEQDFENQASERKKISRCKFFYAIYQFMLLHQGPILDFTLDMRWSMNYKYFPEIDQILLHLSRKNTLKKLYLCSGCSIFNRKHINSFADEEDEEEDNRVLTLCKLPLTIFSFHQLTDLYLSGCVIYNAPTFNGFGSLTTLFLENVVITEKALVHILSNNPLLKSFTMPDGIVLYGEDDHATSFIELFPVIEHLVLCARNIWLDCFIRGVVPRDVASSLVHLKYLYLEEMCFLVNEWLRFLVLMIVSSPNLEKLKLVCFEEHSMGFDDDLFSVTMRECSDIWLEHLIELEIDGFGNKKPYLEFVKLILAKSPVLKKLRLKVDDNDEVLKLLEALLPFPRASQVVEIIVKYGGGNNIVIHPVEIHVKEVVSQISFRPSNQ